MTTQAEFAAEVVAELDCCGHDDISILDLLDVLASTGLELHRGTAAAAAYSEKISEISERLR